jgi:hypothetical protein
MWGAIPGVGRGRVFFLMVLMSTFQMTAKVFSVALLAKHQHPLLVGAVAVARHAPLPRLQGGATGLRVRLVASDGRYEVLPWYVVSFLTRTLVKVIADTTGFLNARVATEMGGVLLLLQHGHVTRELLGHRRPVRCKRYWREQALRFLDLHLLRRSPSAVVGNGRPHPQQNQAQLPELLLLDRDLKTKSGIILPRQRK